jgi:hypothetical protein
MRLEFVLQCIFGTGLAGLRLDVQVDEEETWEECSKKDSQVSSELNFQGKRSGRKSINNGVHGKGRGGKSSNWHRGGGSLGKSLGDCVLDKEVKQKGENSEKREPIHGYTNKTVIVAKVHHIHPTEHCGSSILIGSA